MKSFRRKTKRTNRRNLRKNKSRKQLRSKSIGGGDYTSLLNGKYKKFEDLSKSSLSTIIHEFEEALKNERSKETKYYETYMKTIQAYIDTYRPRRLFFYQDGMVIVDIAIAKNAFICLLIFYLYMKNIFNEIFFSSSFFTEEQLKYIKDHVVPHFHFGDIDRCGKFLEVCTYSILSNFKTLLLDDSSMRSVYFAIRNQLFSKTPTLVQKGSRQYDEKKARENIQNQATIRKLAPRDDILRYLDSWISEQYPAQEQSEISTANPLEQGSYPVKYAGPGSDGMSVTEAASD
jgi:hypothetical protein